MRRELLFLLASACALAVACGKQEDPAGQEVPLPGRGGVDAGLLDLGDAGPAVVDAGQDADAGPQPCNGSLACERVVFASSATMTAGAIGNLTGADTKCQVLADLSAHAAVKGRRFRAWLGSSDASAATRLPHGTAPYRLPDGTVIANNWTDLTDGTLLAPIAMNENGIAITGGAWTGSHVDGTFEGDDCQRWTPGGNQGGVGNITNAGTGWTDLGSAGCGNVMHLYCFED